MCGRLLTIFLGVSVFTRVHESRISVRPQNCTIQCVQQGVPQCEYCRISKEDVKTTLGFTNAGLFGGCVPWPCHSFLGGQSPEICQHYVLAPQNVTIEFVENQNPTYDTVVVSWNPSQYGISFLRGFQVTLQALGGTHITCQLFLLQNNQSFTPVHAQRMYHSDPFSHLSLRTQYAVTVMALPVPELWDKFYQSTLFFTRSCPEKNGLENCKKDWYPRHIAVHQDKLDIVVTFNLAPENLGISQYFSACFGDGSRSYMIIKPDLNLNSTHHTYRLLNLHFEINYTCEIAADIIDPVRKTFIVQLQPNLKERSAPYKDDISLAVLVSVGIMLAVSLAAIFTICCQRRHKKKAPKPEIRPDIIEEFYDKQLDEQHYVSLSNRLCPPQVLICYSNNDGSAHERVVLQLATFLQKHMATKVHLDLWDALSIMEEGYLGWYCRKIKESDFVLVVCSRGLNQKQQNQRNEDEDPQENTSLAIITMIGEELCCAKALGQDLSKYMTAIFEYSRQSDIPAMLSLASRYTLPKDLPLLFSSLHGVALQKPGSYLHVENISGNEYSKLPAGAALLRAIQEAKILTNG